MYKTSNIWVLQSDKIKWKSLPWILKPCLYAHKHPWRE
jgi:hypothetical protein